METASKTARNCPTVNNENFERTRVILPEEIVIDIISRLPVKQVFQLKCLSKNFSSIIDENSFINAHLGRSICLRPSIILQKRNDIYLIRSNGIGSESETIVEELPLHTIIDLIGFTEGLTIEGSCNGLVIFSTGDGRCFIWNPATTQCSRLPTLSYVVGMRLVSVAWGFGHCTTSNRYKIVRIAKYDDVHALCGVTVAEVLSYGVDCEWRRLDIGKFCSQYYAHGITVKGTVYWSQNRHDRLLSFDLEEEEFGWIMLPFNSYSNFMEFQGSLAAFNLSKIRKYTYDTYVLKKKGTVDSWEMICTDGDIFPALPIISLNDHQLLLVDISENDIFDGYGKGKEEFSCALYDLKREEIKRIPQALASDGSKVLKLVESMVPLIP